MDDPEVNLRELAKRHRELSGARVSCLGTYQHAAQVWQKGLEYKRIEAMTSIGSLSMAHLAIYLACYVLAQ